MFALLAIVTITIQTVLVFLSLCIDIDQLHLLYITIKAYFKQCPPLRKLNTIKT